MRTSRQAALAALLIGIGCATLAAAPPGAASPPGPPPPAAPFPEEGTYQGRTYPADLLVSRGLACNLLNGALSCYDAEDEAADAAAAAAVRLGPRSAAVCAPPLTVWLDGGFQGASLSYYDFPGWQDLPPAWTGRDGARVSSWRAGCRPARLSAGSNGAPPRISLSAGSSQAVMPAGWNDRALAVFRG
jgi:hypothetical protein